MIVQPRARRPGVTLVEVLVVLGVVAVGLLLVVLWLPTGRENARALRCQAHLRDLGVALTLYDNAVGHLPTVPAAGSGGDSSISALLGQLGVGWFAGLSESKTKPGAPGPPPPPSTILDFLCPSDPWAQGADHPAPVNYRACAGDATDGRNGAFAPGRLVRLADVSDADGTRFTAGFAERLVGDGQDRPRTWNYARVPGVVADEGCGDPSPETWRGDAGSSWAEPGWTSTLYTHALPPDGSPSCVAEDGASARMGASSDHPNAVQVLLLDGSVRRVQPSIAPGVWESLATTHGAADPEGTPGP